METVIFKLNPSFSSYSVFHFLRSIVEFNLDEMGDDNWNVLGFQHNDLAYWNK